MIGDNLRRALAMAQDARRNPLQPPIEELPVEAPPEEDMSMAPVGDVAPAPLRPRSGGFPVWADERARSAGRVAAASQRIDDENRTWRDTQAPTSTDSFNRTLGSVSRAEPGAGRAAIASLPDAAAADLLGPDQWPQEAQRRIAAEKQEAARKAAVAGTAEDRAKKRAAEAVAKQEAENAAGLKRAMDRADNTPPKATRLPVDIDAQRRVEERRRRAADMNASPEEVQAQADAQVDAYRNARAPLRDEQGRPISEEQGMHNRLDRAGKKRDSDNYQESMRRWEVEHNQMLARRDAAVENGESPEYLLQLSREIDAHKPPAMPGSIAEGRTPQEITEPVTTTLEGLPDAERKALKEHYARTHAWEDGLPNVDEKGRPIVTPEVERRVAQDLSMQYGDLEPEERRRAMINDARRAMSAPTVPTAKSGAVGGPGTVGYGNHNNSPTLTREMQGSLPRPRQREDGTTKPGGFSWTADDTRVLPGYGDIVSENGRQRAQAPGRQIERYVDMVDAGQLPLRWDGSQDWINHMTAVGHILRLDPSQHSPQSFALEAARKLGEVQRMIGKDPVTGERKYTIAPVLMEGDNPHYTYVPTASTKKANEVQALRTDVGEFIDKHALDPEEQRALYAAADAGDKAAIADIKRGIYRDERGKRSNAYQDNRKTEMETRHLQDPRMAPAMLANSLERAGNNPESQARVMDQFGMHADAHRRRMAEVARIGAGGDAERRRLEDDVLSGRGRGKSEPTIPEANAAATREYLNQAFDDEYPHDSAVQSYKAVHDPKMTDENATLGLAREMLQSRGPQVAWMRPTVQAALHSLLKKAQAGVMGGMVKRDKEDDSGDVYDSEKSTFLRLVEENLGIGLADHAERWWQQQQR